MPMPAPRSTVVAAGETSALLFACTVLCSITVQMRGAIGSGPDTPGGQAPSWGGGGALVFFRGGLTPAPVWSEGGVSRGRRPPAAGPGETGTLGLAGGGV